MKITWQKGLRLAAVCAVAFLCSGTSSPAQSLKVGVVDLRKVFNSYYKKVQSDDSFHKEVDSMDKELKGMVDDARKSQDQYQKLLDSANDQAVSADERAKAKQAAEDKYRELASRKEAIDQYNRQAQARLEEEKRKKRDDLVSDIKDHLTVMAKTAGYNLVFDTSGESANMVPVAIYANGLPEITDQLIKELNVGAPTDFKAPSDASASTNK